jgi:hypothetical protein
MNAIDILKPEVTVKPTAILLLKSLGLPEDSKRKVNLPLWASRLPNDYGFWDHGKLADACRDNFAIVYIKTSRFGTSSKRTNV